MEYDPRDGERYRRRLKKNRDYQSEYRDRLEHDGVPERDVVAASAFRALLGSAAANPDAKNGWIGIVVEDLAKANYNPDAVEKSILAMIDRHSLASRKKHRRRP